MRQQVSGTGRPSRQVFVLQRWFIQGMKAGDDINKCNTFNVNDPNTQVVS